MTTYPFSDQLSMTTFLREYWQKRPLILKNVFKKSQFPVRRNQIFDLASRYEFVSRVIQDSSEYEPWSLSDGPFEKKELMRNIEGTNWILLVQNTEWAIDSMRRLLEQFRFIPNWLLDDVQLSFSTQHGSAGPHVDSYDVFLVQLSGEKVWEFESQPISDDRSYIEDLDIQILETFHPDRKLIAEPGDVLYLPPQIPHWGIATEDCITASIGFKIPDQATMGSAFWQMSEKLTWKPTLYSGIELDHINDPGRISDSALDWFQGQMRHLAEDRSCLARILCKGITELHRGAEPPQVWNPPSHDEIRNALLGDVVLVRLSPSLIVYHEFIDAIGVYFLGQETALKKELKPFAELLTGCEALTHESLKPYLENEEVMELLQMLLKLGVLVRSEHN